MRPYFERGELVIYHGRAEDVLPLIAQPEAMIVTDPPYGTGGWRRDATGAGRNPSGALIREAWDAGDVTWLSLIDVAAAFVFWPPARTRMLLETAEACGLTKHRCLYMRKRDPKPMPAGRTRWSVEPIWILSREGFVLLGGDDVYEDSTPRLGRDADATGHPYQKPLSVMRWLISKRPDRPVIDPFMGSGTTLKAAQEFGLACIGIEADEHYCEIAARRLDQMPLFIPSDAEPQPTQAALVER